jgi:hypothetical protein
MSQTHEINQQRSEIKCKALRLTYFPLAQTGESIGYRDFRIWLAAVHRIRCRMRSQTTARKSFRETRAVMAPQADRRTPGEQTEPTGRHRIRRNRRH